MKKRNKKRNSCNITRLWSSVEEMSQDLLIDLDKQEIINLLTGNKLKLYLSGVKNKQYYCITFKKVKIKIHRLFFYLAHGYLPSLIDHKDRNRSNNNINNLRELDLRGNAFNSYKQNRKNASSKYKGVVKVRNKWRARTQTSCGKEIHIGCFNNEDDAGQAYNDKIRELGLEEVSVMNDTPQERARKNIQFDPLPPEMNHLKDLFSNLEPLVDFK